MGHSHQPSSGGSPESIRAGHELTDVKIAPLLQFGVILTIVAALTMWGTFKMYDAMEAYFSAREPAVHPMQSSGSAPAGPLLQADEVAEYKLFKANQASQVSGDSAYSWVDKPAGIVRVPIARANSCSNKACRIAPPTSSAPQSHLDDSMRSATVIHLLAALFALCCPAAEAQQRVENLSLVLDPREYVGYDQKLGAQIPADLSFKDENGATVRLVDYASDRPMVLALVYYSCPRLCTEVLNGSVRMLRAMDRLELGEDFQYVAVSIDPADTPEIALAKRAVYLEALGAETVGFRYVFDEHSQEFAHDGGLVVVTPQGEVSHYFFGVEFSALDVRLALVDASQGKIGNIVDHILLLCMHYDPARGKYGLWVIGSLRIAGVLTLLVLGSFMLRSFLRERRAARPAVSGA
jgi:protein SCO1/2